jgi:hypothetical protein
MKKVRVLLAALAMVNVATDARAQFETATVLGTIRDVSSAIVPEAAVTLTNIATGVSVQKTTNTDGNYEFFTVPAGVYLLSVESRFRRRDC